MTTVYIHTFTATFEAIAEMMKQVWEQITTTVSATIEVITAPFAFLKKKTSPKTWERRVKHELDVLEREYPEAYHKGIPAFLSARPEAISGITYQSCFYGYINNRDSHQAEDMAHAMSKKIHGLDFHWCTPIEEILMHGASSWLISSVDKVSLDDLRGWVQAHYRATQERQALAKQP